METLVIAGVLLLAYANGANDQFKGVATLYGGGSLRYRTALAWTTVTTLAGGAASVVLATALVRAFSGVGLAPAAVAVEPAFVAAVAFGAAATVLAATLAGLPISTTHALTGGLAGAGLLATHGQFAGEGWHTLSGTFLLPLVTSPLAAVVGGGALYAALHRLRLRSGLTVESCVCVGATPVTAAAAAGMVDATSAVGVLAAQRTPAVSLTVAAGEPAQCAQRYVGRYLGVPVEPALNALHILSAGLVCFARGLNDTPKIVALLWLMPALAGSTGITLVVGMMLVGGLFHARRVAETMSRKITPLNHGQGLCANLVTAALTIGASLGGLPVSTTHVAVGSLFGLGLVTGQADRRVARHILFAWLGTLPLAAGLSAAAYGLLG